MRLTQYSWITKLLKPESMIAFGLLQHIMFSMVSEDETDQEPVTDPTIIGHYPTLYQLFDFSLTRIGSICMRFSTAELWGWAGAVWVAWPWCRGVRRMPMSMLMIVLVRYCWIVVLHAAWTVVSVSQNLPDNDIGGNWSCKVSSQHAFKVMTLVE